MRIVRINFSLSDIYYLERIGLFYVTKKQIQGPRKLYTCFVCSALIKYVYILTLYYFIYIKLLSFKIYIIILYISEKYSN